MGFLKRWFGKKEVEPVNNIAGFWKWFAQNESTFYQVLEQYNQVDELFLAKIMPHLQTLNQQFFCSAGINDDKIAELIITAEGDIKTLIFVEQLVAAAPPLNRWKFIAHKPAIGFGSMGIAMDGYTFNAGNIQFYSNDLPEYPDEIDLTIVYSDYNEVDHNVITNGVFLYIDNALGELTSVTLIDALTVTGEALAGTDLIAIDKLSDFLIWREKEFVEKYQHFRYDSGDDDFGILEGQDADGLPSVAVLNTALLQWDGKASHPWMMQVYIEFDGSENNGMPPHKAIQLMQQFDERLEAQLPETSGYLHIGRETYNSKRTHYIACKEFRNASLLVAAAIEAFQDQLSITYSIIKDKYWMTLNKFNNAEVDLAADDPDDLED